MRLFSLISTGFFISSMSMAAAIGDNLLDCKTLGTFKGQCKLLSIPAIPRQPYETLFTMNYTFPCTGPVMGFGIRTSIDPAKDEVTTSRALGYASTPVDVPIAGYGPLNLYDATPSLTGSRPFSKDCSFKINSIRTDLSASEKSALRDAIAHLSTLSSLLTSAKDVESLASSLQVLVTRVDIDSVKTLLKDSHGKLLLLKDSYQGQTSHPTEAVLALDDGLDIFEAAICDNPVFRTAYPEICIASAPTGTGTADTTNQSIVAAFDVVIAALGKFRSEASTALAGRMVAALHKSQYLLEERAKTLAEICRIGKAQGIRDPGCPAE